MADRPVIIDRAEPAVWSTDPGMLTADELAAHERDGFVTVPQLLTPDEVGEYAAELDRLATDPAVRADERTIVEKTSQQVRSVFEVHALSEPVAALIADERVAGRARQILGSGPVKISV
ncbi:phytanoyl-CoA dioxygenase family protein [Pseudonocardia oceani]|uniref:phytanoyl-CoA dioxygenase family protein n=1 Tax=Pseudonocardia oceani TaxID=2792013 RepID=UPI001CF6A277|nr:phytanoyl-CoA dioxygenase family protein [Pseudonocardia oceani]